MAGAVPSGAAQAAAHHSLVWGQQVLLLQTEAQAITPVFNYIGTYREQAGTGRSGGKQTSVSAPWFVGLGFRIITIYIITKFH